MTWEHQMHAEARSTATGGAIRMAISGPSWLTIAGQTVAITLQRLVAQGSIGGPTQRYLTWAKPQEPEMPTMQDRLMTSQPPLRLMSPRVARHPRRLFLPQRRRQALGYLLGVVAP